jgi:hypothetical protein
LPRELVEQMLTDERHSLRDRLLWRMLYETAARSAEILAQGVEDLDRPNRCSRVRRKGGAQDVIVWQTGTARLLPRYLQGRTTGPLFVTSRRARVELPPGDIDEAGHARLSYRQAEDAFKAASGATLRQLRHSALTHAAERGDSTPMLMARSGHTSVRGLARYARVSAEALRAHQAATDPADVVSQLPCVLVDRVSTRPVPAWWDYPRECDRGHLWGPGLVIISWTPCGCAGAATQQPPGHRTVSCAAEGCRSTWYRPRHEGQPAEGA